MRRTALLIAATVVSSWLLGSSSTALAATCSVPTASYPMIQSAVNDPACDTIEVDPGIYDENVVINRELVLDGAGAGVTIVKPTVAGPAITVTAGGSGSTSRLVISDLTTTEAIGGGNTGSGIQFAGSGAVSHVTLDGVASIANTGHGVAVNSAGTMSDLVFTGVDLSDNAGSGFRVPTVLISLDGLTIQNSTLERNTIGMEIYVANSPTAQPVSNVLVEDTSFDANRSKGIYAERLSAATLRRISVVGSGTLGGFAAGIDVNLKYRAYEDVAVLDSVITDNGAGDPVNGVGVTIKARDDAPSYSALPATLTGVTLEGNTIARNSSDGVRLGEPGKNNVGPIDVDVNFNSLTQNVVFGINNQSQTTTDGTCNWWGSQTGPGPVGPGTGDRVSTKVTYEPWLTAPPPGGPCNGPIVTPSSKADCRNDGWMDYTDADGRPFKNQGDCVSYVATGGRNSADG